MQQRGQTEGTVPEPQMPETDDQHDGLPGSGEGQWFRVHGRGLGYHAEHEIEAGIRGAE